MKVYIPVSRASSWVRTHNKAPFFVALMVFVATFAAYLYYWSNLRSNVAKDMNVAYQRQIRILNGNLTSRLQLYETLLRGGAGLFMLKDSISGSNWGQYFEPYEISKNYPDIRGIAFGRYVPKDQLSAFIADRRANGEPDFDVFPAGERAVYVPATFSVRYNGSTTKINGFDGYEDPVRRDAMDRAAASGLPAMTGRVDAKSPDGKTVQPVSIIYMPVYKPGLPLTSADERRAALYGFTYMGIDLRRMLHDLQNSGSNSNFAIRLTDPQYKALHPQAVATYSSDGFEELSKQVGSLTTTSDVVLYGRTWQMSFVGGPALISASERELPAQALVRGVFSSLLFACIVWYLITYRERKVDSMKQREVQTAKDDLLSLASHQLRTPATVVKQYVGMLLQGYGGKLTEQQTNMLTSAYASNERQLEIINQLLYVARLDAGRLILRKDAVPLKKLIEDVVADQYQTATERRQKITTDLPKRLEVYGDPRYLRMVFENLLSNAIKYTPEGGRIKLHAYPAGTDKVAVAVSDNGVGMSPEATKPIFEKFTRVENILSTDVNGSGVGLYLTKEIMALHGGTISVESALGAGSTFIVILPKPIKQPGTRGGRKHAR